MKKILTLLALTGATLFGSAQVNVTYRVDITNYLSGGATLAANGMRVGGNFTDLATTVAQWNPTDTTCAMTNLGNNIWSITVSYPTASIGQSQLFKFVNGNWGTNEGTDPNNTLVSGGCAVADAGGNINRSFTIPASDVTLTYCFDQCVQCDGSSPTGSTSINQVSLITEVNVSPNPSNGMVNFNFNLHKEGGIEISIFDLNGKKVMVNNTQMLMGSNNLKLDISTLEAGFYTYQISSGNDMMSAGKLLKN
jgi:hypothetical protein